MLSRRKFFAGCALCAITGFAATDASAQSSPPAGTPGLTRKLLQQIDGPTPGYVTIVAEVIIDAGAKVARHTHPGIESSYIVEGGGELVVEGQPNRMIKAGDGFQIPVGVPHLLNNGDKPTKLTGTYIIEKGKPLASPA